MTDGTTCGILGHSRRPEGSARVHLPRVAAVLWAAAVLDLVGLWPAMAVAGNKVGPWASLAVIVQRILHRTDFYTAPTGTDLSASAV